MRPMHIDDWYIPFRQDDVILRDALASMTAVQAPQGDIPLMVQLVENPRYRIPGLSIFHGAVDLAQHDFIHIILGRGVRAKDEAFTIGFTMGSTKRVSTSEEDLYAAISRYLYPGIYKFTEDDILVFRDAVRLGFISECAGLDELDFEPWLDWPLRDIREQINLEKDLLLAYFAIEKKRFPDAIESQRLLDETGPSSS